MSKINKGLKDIANQDPIKSGRKKELFIGHPFSLDYFKSSILVCDDDKEKVQGISQGAFLLAFYDNNDSDNEAILLRALGPAKLPTDTDMISSMIEYYKDSLPTSGKESKLDTFTKYHFSFSGLECRVLGTFYYNSKHEVEFGADLENFYSAHHYSVYKLTGDLLGFVVNQRDSPEDIPGSSNEFQIGTVRYSSSKRFSDEDTNAKVWISPKDLLGKRTALFGMTRTGKSNTVKKIIEATTKISMNAKFDLKDKSTKNKEFLSSENFDAEANPTFPVGQIIFDVNGEYANKNIQDETAIYEKFSNLSMRYSIMEKPEKDFRIMRINFYKEIEMGFSYMCSALLESEKSTDYLNSFMAVDFAPPKSDDFSAIRRCQRNAAIYHCCLYKAGFDIPHGFTIKFEFDKSLAAALEPELQKLNTKAGISPELAIQWFSSAWANKDHKVFIDYKRRRHSEWFTEDMKSLMVMLMGKREGGGTVSGYKKMVIVKDFHTNSLEKAFEDEILTHLRQGKITIVDLSQGNPTIQNTFLDRISKRIFGDSMKRFTEGLPNNFIQFYFEEAHNLFPKKDEKDLSQIYTRIAKEGAKLNLGMLYATQEVSSISSNILKNTQNWFIAHLNNDDEIRELRKYYDFEDFTDSLIRFSAKNDKGFVRMKTHSNPFVVPIQVEKFVADPKNKNN